MEKYERLCKIIKKINERMILQKYKSGSNSEQYLFLMQIKAEILDLELAEEEIYLAIATSGQEENLKIDSYLVIEHVTLDDNGDPVFVYIDLESMKIGLGDDGGFPTLQERIIDGKRVKPDFLIQKLIPSSEILIQTGYPKVALNDYTDYLEVVEYLRNNPKIVLAMINTQQIKR